MPDRHATEPYSSPIFVGNMAVLIGQLYFLLKVTGKLLVAIKHIQVAFRCSLDAFKLYRRDTTPSKIVRVTTKACTYTLEHGIRAAREGRTTPQELTNASRPSSNGLE